MIMSILIMKKVFINFYLECQILTKNIDELVLDITKLMDGINLYFIIEKELSKQHFSTMQTKMNLKQYLDFNKPKNN